MRSLKSVVLITTMASTIMMAQLPRNQSDPQRGKADPNRSAQPGRAGDLDKPLADKPAGQADRPASQARESQAAPSSTSTGSKDSRTFTGTIVNADCSQASSLTNRGSFADRSASSTSSASSNATSESASPSSKSETKTASAGSTVSDKDNKSVYDLERDVLKHCPANSKVTTFAVVTDDGNFYKLDDTGNSQVMSQAGDSDKQKKKLKNMRVTVTGTVQGDTLKVQSLTKTDKPFGGA